MSAGRLSAGRLSAGHPSTPTTLMAQAVPKSLRLIPGLIKAMPRKRTIESFFSPAAKKARASPDTQQPAGRSSHASYPFPIANLPTPLSEALSLVPVKQGRVIADQPDLDLVYYEPYIPARWSKQLFEFLRSELPFYRVEYDIKRGGIETHIRTPRFTTIFGLDETCRFGEDGTVVDAQSDLAATHQIYETHCPRPIPQCLDMLRRSTEEATGCGFNFCLVNYYASGSDSISFHSDDERFLGKDPAIASFSLGASRDFLMKHKPPPQGQAAITAPSKTIKFTLASGDMVLMRGRTQPNWLHSVPKRSGRNREDGGRINITFRRAVVKGGTSNYYTYNVGAGPMYRWDDIRQEFLVQSTNGKDEPADGGD